jgi:SMC interacting uncharacterized protein involved in chromosome segregation
MTDEIDAELSEIENLQKENKHLKQVVGDQGNQIGDLRKVVAEQIQSQQESDWDYDPQEKELRDMKSQINEMKTAEALRQLETDYPGFRELPKNTEFTDWIGESQVRADLYRRADQMDLAAAREMLSLWQEREKLKVDLEAEGNTQRRRALRDASMEKGSAGGKKTAYWDRTELVEMRRNRPDEWAAKWPEIQKAYAEGRVK